MSKEKKGDDQSLPKKSFFGNFNRRRFLKGAGISTAGFMVGQSVIANTPPETPSNTTLGPEEVPLKLLINQKQYEVWAKPSATLAEVLRDKLELTGTKVVCGRGACSACTVQLNEDMVCSCLTLALDAQGKDITTIEGLAQEGKLHPVQEAFIEEDASMCGYCTPGMVMSCVGLLNYNPDPSLDEVKKAISGNLCRCGTYPHVFQAALSAAKKMK